MSEDHTQNILDTRSKRISLAIQPKYQFQMQMMQFPLQRCVLFYLFHERLCAWRLVCKGRFSMQEDIQYVAGRGEPKLSQYNLLS